jgi:hypothetical protein
VLQEIAPIGHGEPDVVVRKVDRVLKGNGNQGNGGKKDATGNFPAMKDLHGRHLIMDSITRLLMISLKVFYRNPTCGSSRGLCPVQELEVFKPLVMARSIHFSDSSTLSSIEYMHAIWYVCLSVFGERSEPSGKR